MSIPIRQPALNNTDPIITKFLIYVSTMMLYCLVSASIFSLNCFWSQDSPKAVPKEILENINTNPAITDKTEIMLNALTWSFNTRIPPDQ